jgi:XapX domain-containing protein
MRRPAGPLKETVMLLLILGFALALGIGIGCRLLDIPLPAPPRLEGALLVVAMTLGFLAGQHWFA